VCPERKSESKNHYTGFDTIKLFTMGREKVSPVIDMKLRNIFLCFYWLPLARVQDF
jgi:hypothetical protein